MVLQADLVMDSGATKTGIGVEAMRVLVDAVKRSFPASLIEVESLDRPWFRFADGHWGRAISRVLLLSPMGWVSIYTLDAENVPDLAGVSLLDNNVLQAKRVIGL